MFSCSSRPSRASGVAVAHLEAPQGLFRLLLGLEQREVEQVDADHRLEPAVILACVQLFAQETGQIQDSARIPGGKAAQFDLGDRWLVAAHDVDQVDQQLRLFGEDAEEDVVVLGIEQSG